MQHKKKLLLISILFSIAGICQNPFKHFAEAVEARYSSSQPIISYELTVNEDDLSTFQIEMKLRKAGHSFQLAMMAHPEYDDRYYRYVESFSAETNKGKAIVTRMDSALWRIESNADEIIVHYKIHLPVTPPSRPSWRPYLSKSGGLVGGPHSFMYVVGAEMVPSYVKLNLPLGWKIATGLESTSDPYTFFAPSAGILVDCPIMIGQFRTWTFTVDAVPHRIVYLCPANAPSFDSLTLVNSIKKLVEQNVFLFGRLPYRDYTFMLEDGAYGALEHTNSVTIGAPASQLAENINGYLGTIAHEYFHTWNLVRIRPAESTGIMYKTPPASRGLWWSEGVTLLYANIEILRAGLPYFDTTRIKHIKSLILRFYSNAGNWKISPENVSLASDAPPGVLGDYAASTHLQGELLGIMLDLMIKDATDDKHSLDDVMRLMMDRFSGEKGFFGSDIEKLVSEVCNCNVKAFFEENIFGSKPIDFNRWLKLVGLNVDTSWSFAKGQDGNQSPDLRIYSYMLPGQTDLRIGLIDPESCWGRAGLHTGDIIRSINNNPVTTREIFSGILKNIKIGEKVNVEIIHSSSSKIVGVSITGYRQPEILIREISGASEKVRNRLKQWMLGK